MSMCLKLGGDGALASDGERIERIAKAIAVQLVDATVRRRLLLRQPAGAHGSRTTRCSKPRAGPMRRPRSRSARASALSRPCRAPTRSRAPAMKHLIAIDWGTSSLRGALLAGDGSVLRGKNSRPRPAHPVRASGRLRRRVCAATRPLAAEQPVRFVPGLRRHGRQLRQGWQEAPYCACPAGFASRHRFPTAPGSSRAGLPWCRDSSCEDQGVPDVMRGEETQVFGALDLLGLQDARMDCYPARTASGCGSRAAASWAFEPS